VVSHWSDHEIARQCRVGAPLIGRLREEIRPATVTNYSEPKTFTTKYGTVAKMNTAAIGKGTAFKNRAAWPAGGRLVSS